MGLPRSPKRPLKLRTGTLERCGHQGYLCRQVGQVAGDAPQQVTHMGLERGRYTNIGPHRTMLRKIFSLISASNARGPQGTALTTLLGRPHGLV